MSPLFPCSCCGVQIERSVRLYREQKGRVLCSTCKDRQEPECKAQARSAPAGSPADPAPHDRDTGGGQAPGQRPDQ